jgi:hypothetical protein
MAITNYTDLQTTIADFLNRDDLTAVIPTFIQLAEANFNRDIRHWKMEARSAAPQTAGQEYMAVPPDWLETIRMHVTDLTVTPRPSSNPITLVSRDQMADIRYKNNDAAGKNPFAYTHADGQFQLYPTPPQNVDIELLYYQKIPSLSATTATNWLITEAPDVYLYGTLVHSAPYLAEDARVAVWAQMYGAAVQNLNTASEETRYSGSGMKLKIRGMG